MAEMLPEDTGVKTKHTVDLPPQGRYGFVGREDEMMRLGRAFQKDTIVLLTGPAGIGKTELACGFARQLVDSEDRQGGILFTAFEYGAGLCRLLHEMGTTLRGISFARLSQERQRQWIIEYLKGNRCLLIWDNFENVFQYLDNAESQELVDFLKDIGDGPSYVLINGRGKDLIDDIRLPHMIECGHEALRGLNEEDTQQLARLILDSSGVDVRGLGPEYPELLGLLRGNPMSMRLVLPHLKQHSPSELAQSLGQGGISETELVDAALACSFSRLSPRTRAHLPFLALFQQRVLLDVLTFMTQGEVYVSVTGEEMGWGACRTFLREAHDCGILESISPSVYLIPPIVSQFLGQQLDNRLTLSQIDNLAQEFIRVYADLGDYFLENLSSESAESTVTGVLAEEANLLQSLHLAEAGGGWGNAQLILQPLGQVYKMQERVQELRRLRERLLAHVGQQAEQREAIELWMYLQGTELNDAIARQELEVAEGICYTVLRYLESLGDAAPRPQIASIYHHLGLIAQDRSQYEQAEEWYRMALEINEPLGNEAECADSYHQLGTMAQSRGQYEQAEEWHRRALEIRERLEDEAEQASECHQLALVSEARYQFQDALEWYHRARIAYEHVDDKAGAAAVCHKVGLIAQVQYDYEEATGWYQKALMLYEEMEDEVTGASDYYQLGVMALHRYDYGEGEEWLHQALRAYERMGNEVAVASSYHQLGVASHAQQRYQEAGGRYQKAVEIFVRLGDEEPAASTWGQLGLLADQLGNYPYAVWYVAHTYEIAVARQLPLLSHAKEHLSNLRSKMGTEAFIRCWQEVSDTDVLSELES